MKIKIKEALQQAYKNLGLSEDVFERVAASVETFIKEESEIGGYVSAESTELMLKTFQSIADKARASRKNEQNQSNVNKGENPDGEVKVKPEEKEQPDIAAIIKAALEAELNPLKDKLAALETQRLKDSAVSALDKLCETWDYANGFPKERDEAKRIAMKIYKASGEKMDSEQLIAAFREEFDPAVAKKGVTDFSKPFENDGNTAKESKTDFSDIIALLDAPEI